MKAVEEHLKNILMHQRDWDERLPIFLLSYRGLTSGTTSMIPSRMVFGSELLLPCILFSWGFPQQGGVYN
jgi:hypothetical protein